MKLSNAQQKVLDEAKSKIDTARRLDYPEWLKTTQHIPERFLQKSIEEGHLKDYWVAYRNAESLTHCNSKTLVKLEEYGLIEIIEDSNGQDYGIDRIKVLNY